MSEFITGFLASEDCFGFRGILAGVAELDRGTGFDDCCVKGEVSLLPLLLQEAVLGLSAG